MADPCIAPWAEPDELVGPSIRAPQPVARAPLDRHQAAAVIAPWDTAESAIALPRDPQPSDVVPWDPPSSIVIQPNSRHPMKAETPLDISLEPVKCLGCLYGPCPRRPDQSIANYLAMLCVGLAGCQCFPCFDPSHR